MAARPYLLPYILTRCCSSLTWCGGGWASRCLLHAPVHATSGHQNSMCGCHAVMVFHGLQPSLVCLYTCQGASEHLHYQHGRPGPCWEATGAQPGVESCACFFKWWQWHAWQAHTLRRQALNKHGHLETEQRLVALCLGCHPYSGKVIPPPCCHLLHKQQTAVLIL